MSTLYENYTINDEYLSINSNTRRQGQTFTPSTPHTIEQVDLLLYKIGSPIGTLKVGIYATSGGKPTGSELAQGTIDVSTLTTSSGGAWYSFILSSNPNLHSGTQYAIVVYQDNGTIGGSDHARWRADGTTVSYTGGARVNSDDNGANWDIYTGEDADFKEYGTQSAVDYTALPITIIMPSIMATYVYEQTASFSPISLSNNIPSFIATFVSEVIAIFSSIFLLLSIPKIVAKYFLWAGDTKNDMDNITNQDRNDISPYNQTKNNTTFFNQDKS